MLTLVVTAALAATAPVKLASPGLSLVAVDPAKGAYFSEKLASAMVSDALSVITARQMQAMLGLERQKQLIGCNAEGESCLAELGAALGVDGLLLGDLAIVGKRYELTAKVISPNDGKVLALRNGIAQSEDELSDLIVKVGQSLAVEVLKKLGRAVPEHLAAVTIESDAKGPRRYFWAPLAVGAVLLVAAGIVELVAQITFSPVRDSEFNHPIDTARAQQLANQANQLATVALALACGGGAALLTSVGLAIFGGPREIHATAWLAPGSGGFGLAGAWP